MRYYEVTFKETVTYQVVRWVEDGVSAADVEKLVLDKWNSNPDFSKIVEVNDQQVIETKEISPKGKRS